MSGGNKTKQNSTHRRLLRSNMTTEHCDRGRDSYTSQSPVCPLRTLVTITLPDRTYTPTSRTVNDRCLMAGPTRTCPVLQSIHSPGGTNTFNDTNNSPYQMLMIRIRNENVTGVINLPNNQGSPKVF